MNNFYLHFDNLEILSIFHCVMCFYLLFYFIVFSMSDNKSKLAFGFKQCQKKNVIKPNSKVVSVESEKKVISKVYITSIENNVIQYFEMFVLYYL